MHLQAPALFLEKHSALALQVGGLQESITSGGSLITSGTREHPGKGHQYNQMDE